MSEQDPKIIDLTARLKVKAKLEQPARERTITITFLDIPGGLLDLIKKIQRLDHLDALKDVFTKSLRVHEVCLDQREAGGDTVLRDKNKKVIARLI